LTRTYTVTVEGTTVSTTMTMNAKYAYDDVKPITAPADADSYEEADYDDLMG
jgi:carbohydrate-binding DOMON domain-containing protein